MLLMLLNGSKRRFLGAILIVALPIAVTQISENESELRSRCLCEAKILSVFMLLCGINPLSGLSSQWCFVVRCTAVACSRMSQQQHACVGGLAEQQLRMRATGGDRQQVGPGVLPGGAAQPAAVAWGALWRRCRPLRAELR